MMVISFLIMYLIMFLNMETIDHYHTSDTRIYMAMLMVSPMAIVMMLMMGRMYPDRKMNRGIIVSAAFIFALSLILLRAQFPIDDKQYMKAMIPHHSSAIMTSRNANIQDPEVKKLSEQIIKSQEEEIAQMESILKRLR